MRTFHEWPTHFGGVGSTRDSPRLCLLLCRLVCRLFPKPHSDQPPDRFRSRGLGIRLSRNPRGEFSFHVGIEANANDGADAGRRASHLLFWFVAPCAQSNFLLTECRTGARSGLAPALTNATPCEGGEGWLLRSLIEGSGEGYVLRDAVSSG